MWPYSATQEQEVESKLKKEKEAAELNSLESESSKRFGTQRGTKSRGIWRAAGSVGSAGTGSKRTR